MSFCASWRRSLGLGASECMAGMGFPEFAEEVVEVGRVVFHFAIGEVGWAYSASRSA